MFKDFTNNSKPWLISHKGRWYKLVLESSTNKKSMVTKPLFSDKIMHAFNQSGKNMLIVSYTEIKVISYNTAERIGTKLY